LNLPGSPEGAAFSAEHVMAAIVTGRRRLPYQPGNRYFAAVDMSGGSNDDSTLAIAHKDQKTGRAVLDLVVAQNGRPPFNPRHAVGKFAALCHEYNIGFAVGDNYEGQTFRFDFLEHGLGFDQARLPRALGVMNAHVKPGIPRQERTGGQPSASDFFEALEPRLAAAEIELLDVAELQEQLLTLIWRGGKIDHEPSGHSDYANAAAIALILAAPARPSLNVGPALLSRIRGELPQPSLPPDQQHPQPQPMAPHGRLHVSNALLARLRASAPVRPRVR
jgi:hypothetical protein